MIKYNFENRALCPQCDRPVSYSLPDNEQRYRDKETMGGKSIEYVYCENCKIVLEIIEDKIFPS